MKDELERYLLKDLDINRILEIVKDLDLADSWICAGTIRNFIWNHYRFDKNTEQLLYCYFKVKFRNRIKDRVRRQESQKRKFDRMPHEDIHDLSHVIQSPGLVNDELLMLRGALRDYRKNLSMDQLENYEKLISGQSFNGRKNMLRDLQEHLKDFR